MKTVLVTTQPAAPNQPFDIWSAISLVKDGSYAIVIFLVVGVVVTRKTVSQFLDKHFELMESLKKSNEDHQENLEKLTTSFQEISKNNSIALNLLVKHMKDHDQK